MSPNGHRSIYSRKDIRSPEGLCMTYKPMFPDSRTKEEIYAPITEERRKLIRQVVEDEKEALKALKRYGD